MIRSSQAVNYFLHTGHLNIDGLKMSKSLKNFITIRQTLEKFTPNQVRMCFLLHKWNTTMNYSDGALDEARAKEKLFNNFFQNVKTRLRTQPVDAPERWQDREVALNKELMDCREAVRESLCDDFNTEGAMRALEGLVRAYNQYAEDGKPIVAPLVTSCGEFVSNMFRVFGLIEPEVCIGFPENEYSENTIGPLVNIVSSQRDECMDYCDA